ncbi:MAG: class I SAM-dependent methyltransferase [Myxococcota bacterium]|nr:class I SAM-dependent methyltransferase [Myxococcota bacterium]
MSYRLYHELAPYWPQLSPPELHAAAAGMYLELLSMASDAPIQSLLELGCGSGHLASHLPAELDIALLDLSEEMLALSRAVNPDRPHHRADMRTARLGRTFDAVLLHDAVMYMSTPADLRAALTTAAVHCRPGGAVLVVPDVVAETFAEGAISGGGDAAQLLEWHHSAGPHSYRVDFALMLRDGVSVRCIHEQHELGLFSRGLFWEALTGAGMIPVAAELPLDEVGEVFLSQRSPDSLAP